MTTPVNVNQLLLPSALQIGPGGELITFDAAGLPVVFDPSVPGSITFNALDVLYDNAASGLTATNVQDAIDELDTAIDNILGGGGGLDFTDLGDTPASYVGQGGLFVRVNVGETGLEFAAAGGGSFDIDALPAAAIASGDIIAFSGASVGGTESQATTAQLASVMITEGVGQSFDIDTLPAAAIASGDIIAFSGASVGGTESAATTAELATIMITEGVGQAFDIDALPAGTADDTADLIAISDQSDTGTEKSISITDLGALLGGGGGLVGVQAFTTNGTYTATGGTNSVLVICTGGGGAGTASGSPSGNTGGNSSFGAFCTGNGGTGAISGGSGSPGAGGTATGGVLNITGGAGSKVIQDAANPIASGGASFFGGGGNTSAYGAGGEGIASGGNGVSGGAGGTAIEFISSGFGGASVTVGAGGTSGTDTGSPGVVLVLEFG